MCSDNLTFFIVLGDVLVLSFFSVLTVLTVHTGVEFFCCCCFFTVFIVLLVEVHFGWYANLCIFDSFESYGFVLGHVLTVLSGMVLLLGDLRMIFLTTLNEMVMFWVF